MGRQRTTKAALKRLADSYEDTEKGWHIGYDYAAKIYKKRMYEAGAIGFLCGAIISALWTVYFINF